MAERERPRIRPLTRDALPAAAWWARVPIRFGHCDPAGIVFTPRYFDMLNEVVERFFLEALGLDYYGMITERRLGLGYAHASCEFLRPSRMGEVLEATVLVESLGRASSALLLPLLKDRAEVVRGRFVTVATSLDTHRACPMPDDLRTALDRYREACGPMSGFA